jgi:3-isopropylmalate dehydrogenase
MLLRYSLDLNEEADAVESAVKKVLADGYRTGDIAAFGDSTGIKKVGTKEMGDAIAERIEK